MSKFECPHNPAVLCKARGYACQRCGWSPVVDMARRVRIPGLALAHLYRSPGAVVGLHLKEGR